MKRILDWLLWIGKIKAEKMTLGPYNSMLQFFQKQPVTDDEQTDMDHIRQKFFELANWIDIALPSNPERTVALRKLLESMDAAVRSRTFKSA